MPKVEVEHQTIYYEVFGDGPQTVVLLPGFLGIIELDFGPVIPLLDKSNIRWICWDPPGCGRSRPQDVIYNEDIYEHSSHILEKFMQNLGYEKYSIVGWSHGGSTGMLLASRCPEKVVKCVFWGCFAHYTPTLLRAFEFFPKLESWPAEKLEAKLQYYEKHYLRKICTDMLNGARKINEKGGKLLGDTLPSIKCPALLLHGQKDSLTDAEQPKILNSAFADSRIHYFPYGGHDLHLQFPAEFKKIVENFLLQ